MDKGAPLRQLVKRRDKLTQKLADYKNILRGTVVKRGNICGKKGCKCKQSRNPISHGPYQYLSHRSRQKTQMVFLNKTKLTFARRGIEEYRELIDTIYQISEINFQILRYHYRRLYDEK
ncbi:MAG: hypothetical protein KJ569_03805 [Candidatus Omnitrophica bacterium]|nr:hypothetical protein [Candidatus Omnitrophota bacterium]